MDRHAGKPCGGGGQRCRQGSCLRRSPFPPACPSPSRRPRGAERRNGACQGRGRPFRGSGRTTGRPLLGQIGMAPQQRRYDLRLTSQGHVIERADLCIMPRHGRDDRAQRPTCHRVVRASPQPAKRASDFLKQRVAAFRPFRIALQQRYRSAAVAAGSAASDIDRSQEQLTRAAQCAPRDRLFAVIEAHEDAAPDPFQELRVRDRQIDLIEPVERPVVIGTRRDRAELARRRPGSASALATCRSRQVLPQYSRRNTDVDPSVKRTAADRTRWRTRSMSACGTTARTSGSIGAITYPSSSPFFTNFPTSFRASGTTKRPSRAATDHQFAYMLLGTGKVAFRPQHLLLDQSALDPIDEIDGRKAIPQHGELARRTSTWADAIGSSSAINGWPTARARREKPAGAARSPRPRFAAPPRPESRPRPRRRWRTAAEARTEKSQTQSANTRRKPDRRGGGGPCSCGLTARKRNPRDQRADEHLPDRPKGQHDAEECELALPRTARSRPHDIR